MDYFSSLKIKDGRDRSWGDNISRSLSSTLSLTTLEMGSRDDQNSCRQQMFPMHTLSVKPCNANHKESVHRTVSFFLSLLFLGFQKDM